MKRLFSVGLLVSMVMLGAAARASAQSPWTAPLAEAETLRGAGDDAGARRKYQEAWDHARFAAVYNPTDQRSGANRPAGLPALRAILTAANNLAQGGDANRANLDFVTGLRNELNGPDGGRGTNSIEGGAVLSGGRSNYGLWRVEVVPGPGQIVVGAGFGGLWNLKQNGTAVGGRIDADTEGLTDFARSRFDGARLTVHMALTAPGGPPLVVTGDLTLSADGNTFNGALQDTDSRGKTRTTTIRLVRVWR
jgi:hypothetical protein